MDEIIDTSGFYKRDSDVLLYAPNFVLNADYELRRETREQNALPVDGWAWFDSAEAAYASHGLPLPAAEPLPDPTALDKVKALNGFHYEANEVAQSLGYEVKPEVGVSAQEVQMILPEIVVPAPINDRYLTVHYEKLIPLLIEAIKEQQVQIEELKAKLGN